MAINCNLPTQTSLPASANIYNYLGISEEELKEKITRVVGKIVFESMLESGEHLFENIDLTASKVECAKKIFIESLIQQKKKRKASALIELEAIAKKAWAQEKKV